MTQKSITLKFVVPTVLAIAFGIMISIGTTYLKVKDIPIDKAEAIAPSPAAVKLLSCQTMTGGFRALTCCFPV